MGTRRNRGPRRVVVPLNTAGGVTVSFKLYRSQLWVVWWWVGYGIGSVQVGPVVVEWEV